MHLYMYACTCVDPLGILCNLPHIHINFARALSHTVYYVYYA